MTQPHSTSPHLLQTLFILLKSFHETQKVRTLLARIFITGHRFCLSCTLTRTTPGSCGPTCPLLSPLVYDPQELDEEWVIHGRMECAIVRGVLREVRQWKEEERKVEVEKAQEWVKRMERVRWSGLSDLERVAEGVEWGMEKCRRVKGLDLGWVFERAWRDEVEEVSRNVMKRGAGRKRKVEEVDRGRGTPSRAKKLRAEDSGTCRKRLK